MKQIKIYKFKFFLLFYKIYKFNIKDSKLHCEQENDHLLEKNK